MGNKRTYNHTSRTLRQNGDEVDMNKNQYKIRLEQLKELYNIGKKVSLLVENKKPTTIRSWQAEKVVEKVLLHCNSIIKLFAIGMEDYSELDIGLVASASRNIMDAGNIYFYITERGISEEEVEFRYNLQSLNYEKNIKDIFKKLDFPMDSFWIRVLDSHSAAEEIKKSSIYVKADNNGKSSILSGKQLFNKKPVGIFDRELESAIYNILSNSIHSFYIGLSNNSIQRSGIFASYIDSVMLSIIAVEVAIVYAAHIINDYLLLRRQLSKKITDGERDKIRELMDIGYLSDYLEAKRNEFRK